MDENFKMLEKELKYLTDDARNLELKSKEDILKNGLINVSELANKIMRSIQSSYTNKMYISVKFQS